MGSIMWLLISSNLCQLGWRISRVVALKKHWRRRRLIACSLSFAELGIQWVSSTVANVYWAHASFLFARSCQWACASVLCLVSP